MRWAWMIVLLLPGAQAVVFEDPVGDEKTTLHTGEEIPWPQPSPSVDILSLEVIETETNLRLVLQLGEEDAEDSPSVFTQFAVGDIEYRLRWHECRNDPDTATLEKRTQGSNARVFITCLENERDGTGAHDVLIPRSLLTDRAGMSVGTYSPVQNMTTRTVLYVANTGATQASTADFLPDTGVLPDITFEFDQGRFGPYQLQIPDEIRFSNGGPDTIVFTAFFDSDSEGTLLLSIADLPDQWTGHVAPRVHVGDRIAVPIVISIPGAHSHGTQQQFTFLIQDQDDPTITMERKLGVEFLAIPQLAGHHSTLYLHSRVMEAGDPTARGTQQAWLNTVREEEVANELPLQPSTGTEVGSAIYTWYVPLDPALLIGLDFKVDQEGSTEVAVEVPVAHQAAVMTSGLWYCDPTTTDGAQLGGWACQGGWTQLATGKSDPADIPADSIQRFAVGMTVNEVADLIPYKSESNIQMIYELRANTVNFGRVDALDARLHVQDSSLELPLNAYHDPVDVELATGSISLEATGPLRAAVNSGQTAFFTFAGSNEGESTSPLQFQAFGVNKAWGQWHPESLRLRSGTTEEVIYAVTAPEDARVGEFADVALLAEDQDTGVSSQVLRVLVEVVDTPQPEQARPEGMDRQGENTPMLGLAVVLPAVALAAMARRR